MPSNRARVFLAEDEAAILRFVMNILSKDDVCEVVGAAQNGLDALEGIRRLQPDIVITDIIMPMLNGLELMKRAARVCPGAKFIVLTGHERFDFAQQAIELQAVNYLLKPIDVEKLTHTVRESALSLRREREGVLRRQLREIWLSEGHALGGFRLGGRKLYFLGAYLGNFVRLNEWRPDSEELAQADISRFVPEPGMEGYAFDTVTARERMFAVLSDTSCDGAVLKMAEALRLEAFSEGGPVTVTVSERIEAEGEIPGAIERMHHALLFGQRFGHGGVLAAGTFAPEVIAPPERLQKPRPSIGREQLKKWAQEVVRDWESRPATCHAIRADLMGFFSTVPPYGQPHPARQSVEETVEALIACPDYEALKARLIAEMMAWMGIDPAQPGPKEWELSQRIRQYLDATFCDDFDREKLGAHLGYNKNYLTTLFSECFGISPGQYVVKKRIEMAKELIDQAPEMKIKEIAERVGYGDSLYFSRVFKTQTGYSPREYANRKQDSVKRST